MGNGIWIAVVIGAFLIWGIFGGVQTKSIGYTCDLGSPGIFCLMWHENPLGAFGRIVEQVTNELGLEEKQLDFTSDLQFDENKAIFIFMWDDNTNDNPTWRLQVRKFAFTGETTACDITSKEKKGELKCQVTDFGSWSAQGFRSGNRVRDMWKDVDSVPIPEENYEQQESGEDGLYQRYLNKCISGGFEETYQYEFNKCKSTYFPNEPNPEESCGYFIQESWGSLTCEGYAKYYSNITIS